MTAKKYLIETRTNNAGKYTYVRTSDFFYVQNESLKLCCFNLKSCCRFDVTDALTTQQRQDGRLACPCGHTMHSYTTSALLVVTIHHSSVHFKFAIQLKLDCTLEITQVGTCTSAQHTSITSCLFTRLHCWTDTFLRFLPVKPIHTGDISGRGGGGFLQNNLRNN